jgi:hypothetical protein
MAAKVTELKVGTGGRPLGVFKCEEFNMFEEGGRQRYAEFRNRSNDNAAGIKIELMREYSRKTVIVETMEGGNTATTTTEEIILLVHYWEKTPTRMRGESHDDDEANRRSVAPLAR